VKKHEFVIETARLKNQRDGIKTISFCANAFFYDFLKPKKWKCPIFANWQG